MKNQAFVRPVSRTGWYLRQPRYKRYMLRELTCVFIGAYSLLLVIGLMRLAEGKGAWEAYLQALAQPASLVFHLVALAFAVYHSCTWFNLTPKAMPVQRGESFLPGSIIVGAHYAAWALATLVVLFVAGVL